MMPPRRKPTSTRQKKADQQLKRAIKRGDVVPVDAQKKTAHRPKPHSTTHGSPDHAVVAARKLQSAFIKLPPRFLDLTKQLASNSPLLRPIPREISRYSPVDHDVHSDLDILVCPKRPKWSFEMSKLEVERNEEGVFKKYLAQTDLALEKWQNQNDADSSSTSIPPSPSYFERNLEVWRQLWRVTEISQIILLLLDSRCPILHYPPSLSAYLADRKTILVLTKIDIAGPVRVQSWINYLTTRYPNSRIVQVESYVEKVAKVHHQGRKLYEPSVPPQFRARLVEVLKEVHAELLQPPERVMNNPNALKNWVPPVKSVINWDAVMQATGSKVGVSVGSSGTTLTDDQDDDLESSNRQEPNFLTVGLIGQPNVGKSSLLNALFGSLKVRASKTPGKTKHFQTLYWTQDVRLVDCPGLVMPNYVPMEMQVLCGILPISKISAVPACIYYAAQLLPIERIFNLVNPRTKMPVVEDKRTWRDGMKSSEKFGGSSTLTWTAMDILTAYADVKGWVTAKAGRPDVHRAGNAILRALAEGKVAWGFWPPDAPIQQINLREAESAGIWIPQNKNDLDVKSETESEDEVDQNDSEDGQSDEEAEETVENIITGSIGRFGALTTDTDEDDD